MDLPGIESSNAPTIAGTARTAATATGFADLYARSLRENRDSGPLTAEERAADAARQHQAAVAAEHKALSSDLHDFLTKPPAQHLREQVMKEMGISEEDLAKMPPAKRKAMEAEINRRIREKLVGTEKNKGHRPGELEQGGPADPHLTALDLKPDPTQAATASSASAWQAAAWETAIFSESTAGNLESGS